MKNSKRDQRPNPFMEQGGSILKRASTGGLPEETIQQLRMFRDGMHLEGVTYRKMMNALSEAANRELLYFNNTKDEGGVSSFPLENPQEPSGSGKEQ